MSIHHLLAPELPSLRRFARALTGNQKAGDACVASALETVAARPEVLNRASSKRIALYRALLAVRRRRGQSETAREGTPDRRPSPGDRQLQRLTPMSRQAFLLRCLEGFSADQIAEVLEVEPREARRLVELAARDVARQLRTDVLVIEDDPLIALDLEALVEGAGHRVSGIASTHREALEIAAVRPPGLLLADVQLADRSSGLEAVNDLLRRLAAPVIFITAYPERLLSGERPEPAFVVTKPYNAKTVLALVSQALFFHRNARPHDRAVA